MKAILLLSGGVDSTVTLAELIHHGYEVTAMIFDYGQSMVQEVEMARQNAHRMGAAHIKGVKAPLDWVAPQCALLGGLELPVDRTLEAIEAGDTPVTYVPFRNGILLAYAAALGEYVGADVIACGGNGLHSGNYWDNTLEFCHAMEAAIRAGTAPEYQPEVWFPNAERTKAEVVMRGLELGVDFTMTTSCYMLRTFGQGHCGRCDSCVQRRAAMAAYGLDIHGVELP